MSPVQFFSGSFLNMMMWGTLLAIPPLIVLLYFLKLKRQPLEVPSTYLWTRTIEDLHVNTIWQRLRQSLLLFLQLLIILLLILACLQPGWRGSQLAGHRFVFMLDASASMNATDEKPTRLEKAKETALGYIEEMESGDVAMVISFSNNANVEQEFTDNRSRLRAAVNNIRPTNRPTDLTEAMRAAMGLANQSRMAFEATDTQVAKAEPAAVYIFSDGKFPEVTDFEGTLDVPNDDNDKAAFSASAPELGLKPIFVPIGTERPDNVAVVAFTTDRNPEKPDRMEALAVFENYGEEDVTVDAELQLNGKVLDNARVTVPASKDGKSENRETVTFRLSALDEGVLKIHIERKDYLDLDNTAYAALNPPRRSKVLVVTPFSAGEPANQALRLALNTTQVTKLAAISFAEPALLQDEIHRKMAASGAYDLIIYDQCVPTEMPQSNTLFIGRAPPSKGWSLTPPEDDRAPVIIDTDKVHPLTQLLTMNNVIIIEGYTVKGPQGAVELMSANIGTIFTLAPRGGFEDAALGFEIYSTGDDGETGVNTTWYRRRSFPVFVLNVIQYLGGGHSGAVTPSYQPGTPVMIRADGTVSKIDVHAPGGSASSLTRDGQAVFVYNRAEDQGVYRVFEAGDSTPVQHFAINLFDSMESDLSPRSILIKQTEIQGSPGLNRVRRELWKWALMIAMGVLVFEWYVYNRRVYL